MPNQWPQPSALPFPSVAPEAYAPVSDDARWGWVELFVAIQLLWGLFLFVPGMQAVRVYVRALPYLASLGALVYCLRRTGRDTMPSSGPWLLAAIALLGLNLLHEGTHVMAGLGQWALQISIAAPAFWVAAVVVTERRFERVLWLIFGASVLSAAVGVLQVYYPDRLLPPEFSSLAAALNPDFVGALSYVGADGQIVVRPPGLSDLPGGAAVSGMAAMVLGVALAAHPGTAKLMRALSLVAAGVGMTTLYLTQVRSLSIMALLSVLVLAGIRVRQGRVLLGGWIVAGGLLLAIGSFVWATSLGGDSVSDRFTGLFDEGFLTSYQESRGLFLKYTVAELLNEFPFGAGLGRWGMMQVYLGDPSLWQAPPIHVELQITGWLLDGGAPMWFVYGGALVAALRYAYSVAIQGATESLRSLATIVLAIQVPIIAMCFSGPVFNTQLGIEFWTVTAALFGAVQAQVERDADAWVDG